MCIAVVALDAYRSRSPSAEVERFLERLAHALDLAFAVHRNPIDDDHHCIGRRIVCWRLRRCPVLRFSRNRARGELRGLGDRVVGIQAMVSVLNQVTGCVRNRARTCLERRQHDVQPGCVEDSRTGTLDAVATDFAAAFRTDGVPDRREQ